jgi:hypothetical protein
VRVSQLGVLKFPLIILAAWFAVLVFRLISIGGEWAGLDQFTWIILFLWVVIYFFAMFLSVSYGQKRENNFIPMSIRWQNSWVKRLSLFSIFGAILIIYEFAITRDYGFSTPVAIIRQMEVDAVSAGFSGSWLSGIGRILTPALMVAWVLAALGWSDLRRRIVIVLLTASALVFYQQMMFEGGRFYLASLLLMLFFAKGFVRKTILRKRVIRKKRVFWAVLFIVTCFIFGYMFVDRYEQNDRVLSEAYETWAANFDLEVNNEVSTRLSGDLSRVWLAIYMLWAYITQGVNELNTLLLSSQLTHAWGVFQFPQIAQVSNKLLSLDLKYDQLENLPKIGTYNTLYGASYIDFGHIGALVFISIIGWLTGKAIKLLYSHRFSSLSINAPLLITLGVFSPIVSLVVNLWPAFCWALLVGSTVKLSTHQNFTKPTLV